MTHSLRVQPELTTSLRSSLVMKMVSPSSSVKLGDHFSMDRNRAAPVIDTLDSPFRTRKPMTFNNVVLPLLCSGDVANKIGPCTAMSCNHVKIIQSAQTSACASVIIT